MQAKMIVFPSDDGFTVLVWGKRAEGSMRVRSFDNRAEMITLLESLRLIAPEDVKALEKFDFLDWCPLYSTEVDEESLVAHGFRHA